MDTARENGDTTPAIQPPAVAQTSEFASVSLHLYDRLRILSFPPALIPTIRALIQAHWPRGIQEERPYGPSFEFKLRGNPWSGHGSDAVTSRRLISRVLRALYAEGWILHISTDVSCKPRGTDTMVFRRRRLGVGPGSAVPPPPPTPPPCEWTCLSFVNTDRILLVDAPDDLVVALRSMLATRGWMRSGNNNNTYPGAHELRLLGQPWYASGEETMRARQLVLDMVALLERHGWDVYATVDQKAAPQDAGIVDTDTWHCRRVQGWSPGLPVY
ncbi:hypothetical protein F4778DRAFT_723301, partial [Xylariomycetidae sp. FL2044]